MIYECLVVIHPRVEATQSVRYRMAAFIVQPRTSDKLSAIYSNKMLRYLLIITRLTNMLIK